MEVFHGLQPDNPALPKIEDIKGRVREFQRILANPDNYEKNDCIYGLMLDLLMVKNNMELIESKILVFRAEELHEMELLNKAEAELSAEVNFLSERISKPEYSTLRLLKAAGNLTAKPGNSAPVSWTEKTSSNLLPEVVRFQVFFNVKY